MHSQIIVNPRFHGGTKIGKGGPVLAAKIGLGGLVLTGDRFFRYRSSKPETKAASPSGQELTEPAIVGPQHGKDRGGRRGPIGTSMPPY